MTTQSLSDLPPAVQQIQDMPELPRPAVRAFGDISESFLRADHYTADQMQAYAEAHAKSLLLRLEAAEQQWQPIETAPQDKDIQLWARGIWYPDCGWGMQTYPGTSERMAWVYLDYHDSNGPVYTKVIDPSHWMPPPSPPAALALPIDQGEKK